MTTASNLEPNRISGTSLLAGSLNSTLLFTTSSPTVINLESFPAVSTFLQSRDTYIVRYLSLKYVPRSSPVLPLNNWARIRITFPSSSTPNQSGGSNISEFPINLRLASDHAFGLTTVWNRIFRKTSSTTTLRPVFPNITVSLQTEHLESSNVGSFWLDFVIVSESSPTQPGSGGDDQFGGFSI